MSPKLQAEAFNCPRCDVFAKQDWFYLVGASQPTGFGTQYQNKEFVLSKCNSCGEPTIWHGASMIYPLHATAEKASIDLPKEIQEDFEEARLISNFSPRGAAALLRQQGVAPEKLAFVLLRCIEAVFAVNLGVRCQKQ